MKTRSKSLNVPGLTVEVISVASYKYCLLKRDNVILRSYTNKPIERITDFIKLFNSFLCQYNWIENLDHKHQIAIFEMEKQIVVSKSGKLTIKQS